MHLFENIQPISGAIPDAIQVEQNGVQLWLFEDVLDFAFIACRYGPEGAPQVFVDLTIMLFVVRNDGEQIALRAVRCFEQSSAPRIVRGIIGETHRQRKCELGDEGSARPRFRENTRQISAYVDGVFRASVWISSLGRKVATEHAGIVGPK